MENLLFLVSPIVVSLVTSGLKKLNLQSVLTTGKRRAFMRVVVALLAYGVVNGTAALAGGEVDPVATETLVKAVMVFLGSTGVYFFAVKK